MLDYYLILRWQQDDAVYCRYVVVYLLGSFYSDAREQRFGCFEAQVVSAFWGGIVDCADEAVSCLDCIDRKNVFRTLYDLIGQSLLEPLRRAA